MKKIFKSIFRILLFGQLRCEKVNFIPDFFPDKETVDMLAGVDFYGPG
jgi:hypothetical protein